MAQDHGLFDLEGPATACLIVVKVRAAEACLLDGYFHIMRIVEFRYGLVFVGDAANFLQDDGGIVVTD